MKTLIASCALAALFPACATLQDTPAQERSWAAFKVCESSFPGVRITRVEPDGRTWFSYQSAAALAAMQACMDQRRAERARTGQAASPATLAEPPRRALAAPPIPQAAAESSVWAYTAVSETMASFSLIAYARSKIDCEASRARDLYTLERDSPWLKATLEECRSALVLPGLGYWVFTLDQDRMNVGATTQEMCVRLRDEMRKQTPGPATDCSPVFVRFQGTP
jgi:hypothetical protein